MSPTLAATAERTAQERPGHPNRELHARLRDGLEASMSLLSRSRSDADMRVGRRAALAVADAAIHAYGIRPESGEPAPRGAVAAAAEAVGALDEVDRREVATALASLFESEVGAGGGHEQGVVYTPHDVVRFMVKEALAARIVSALAVDDDEARAIATGRPDLLEVVDRRRLARLLGGLRVVDPAVGAGAFLAVAADEISSLAGRLREREVPVARALLTPRGALERCCHGFEVDPDATRMARAVLALGCSGSDNAVPEVVTTRNTLLGGVAHPGTKDGWDVVLMNPPYVGEKHLRERFGDELQRALRERDGFAGDLLSHFLLRALEGVRPGGALSAIVSDTTFTMASAAPVRTALLDATALFSLAWCRPFSVAAQGGIVTAVRGGSAEDSIRCFEVGRGGDLTRARGRKVDPGIYTRLPGRPYFRPSPAAKAASRRWGQVDGLERLWARVGRALPAELETEAAGLEPGEWTLLGATVRAGQGLATGDDRRFVGFVAGSEAARAALRRQHGILETLRTERARAREWRHIRERLAAGEQPGEALSAALDSDQVTSLPGRKPFRVVEFDNCRRTPLSETERREGIVAGPTWIPYETSDRSGTAGGARWARRNPVVIDWSTAAVALLRERREGKVKRPVLRHEELWFLGGVTHNRVASYLRARLMPREAIFSSESPCYVPSVPWLSEFSLLALLNSPVVEFVLKTFLATRNHFELGHLLRVPVPVLSDENRGSLEVLASAAVDSVRSREGVPAMVERELDLLTRNLYGVRGDAKLPVTR